MNFGDMVKGLRIKQQKTLRQFCQDNGIDPSNWSKIERNVNPPPRDEATLAKWAQALGIVPGTEEWSEFMDSAEVSRGNIPKDVMTDEKLLAKLPVFLRTMRGAELTDEQLDDVIAKVREAHTKDKA